MSELEMSLRQNLQAAGLLDAALEHAERAGLSLVDLLRTLLLEDKAHLTNPTGARTDDQIWEEQMNLLRDNPEKYFEEMWGLFGPMGMSIPSREEAREWLQDC